MDLSALKELFELLSYIATVIGIPFAIYVFYTDKVRQRKIKEKEVLFTSHSLYVDYLKMCLENPELEVSNNDYGKLKLSEKERKELIIFEILFTYLESTYLYYEDQSPEIRSKRWKGWINYISEFSHQENFRRAWDLTEGQWDEDFMKFMDSIIKSSSKKISAS
ncbi:MAG: hypothetical protein SGI89_02115 [bacterium]|nr:hypothetical protein [bacterium]